VKPEWEWNVDYPALEHKALFNVPSYLCERCGARYTPNRYDGHEKRDCDYELAKTKQSQAGNVPVPGVLKKVLKVAGVPIIRDAQRIRPEFRTKTGWPPFQLGDYAPVWAVLFLQEQRLGALTSPKRPKVQRAICELQRLKGDPSDQQAILGEHILQGGRHAKACRALIGKAI
jgi:hypothetical protein